jgi:integrase
VIGTMPRPRPPHVHRETTRHGRVVWYARVGKGPRIRIRAEFGSSEFQAEYQAAITGAPSPRVKGAPTAGSLAWLIARYRESSTWFELAPATRRQRDNIFRQVVAVAGHEPFSRITTDTITAGRERRARTPYQARHFLDAMRGLFRWAFEAKHTKTDPTAGVKNLPRKGGQGFIPWTEEHVAAYQRRWPIGTHQRVWLDVLLYSGLRRGDVVRYGRQHVRKGVGTIRLEKGGETITVTLPILPVLERTLAAGPCGDMIFIVGATGKPFKKESFGNAFRDACRAAGVPGSAHGVRKIAATTAANNGATVAQLKALFGWTTDSMPALYTKSADRERLARQAAHMLANDERTSIPAPKHPVRARARKRK